MLILIVGLVILAVILIALTLFGFTLKNIIEVQSEQEAKTIAYQLIQITPYLILFLPFFALFIGHPPLIIGIVDYFMEKWDSWYIKHFPHKIPFGQKWNSMLELLEFEAWLQRKMKELELRDD